MSNFASENDPSVHNLDKSKSSSGERRSFPTEYLRPLPESLIFDIRNVQAMTDIRSHVGFARAWVRLALEKKLLSKHLKTLLSNAGLIRYGSNLKIKFTPRKKLQYKVPYFKPKNWNFYDNFFLHVEKFSERTFENCELGKVLCNVQDFGSEYSFTRYTVFLLLFEFAISPK